MFAVSWRPGTRTVETAPRVPGEEGRRKINNNRIARGHLRETVRLEITEVKRNSGFEGKNMSLSSRKIPFIFNYVCTYIYTGCPQTLLYTSTSHLPYRA